jgi:hypothetical protein
MSIRSRGNTQQKLHYFFNNGVRKFLVLNYITQHERLRRPKLAKSRFQFFGHPPGEVFIAANYLKNKFCGVFQRGNEYNAKILTDTASRKCSRPKH